MVFTFESCQLDPARFELRRGGTAVHVEPQVFEVLVYLVTHRDRVVPKTELLDAMWGDRFVSDSTLTSRLKAARKAIGDDGRGQRLIATVHGVGYRFVAAVADEDHAATTEAEAGTAGRATQEIRYCTSPDGVRIAWASTGSGAAAGQGRELADTSRPGVGQPDLGALDRRAVGRSPPDPVRRAWLRPFRLGRARHSASTPGSRTSSWWWTRSVSTGSRCSGCPRAARSRIAYAVRHPERVTRIVLVGAYARGRLARAATEEEREEAALDLQVGRVGWRRDDPAYRQVFAAQFLPDADRGRWDAFNALQRATTSTRERRAVPRHLREPRRLPAGVAGAAVRP